MKRCDSYYSNQSISSQWLTHRAPRIRQLIEKRKSVLNKSLKPPFSLRSAGWDKIHTLLFLTSKQGFWSSWIQAITSPLSIFRFFFLFQDAVLWSLSAAGVQTLVSFRFQGNWPTQQSHSGAGRAGPGAAEPSLPCVLFSPDLPGDLPGLRVICALLHAWLSLCVRVIKRKLIIRQARLYPTATSSVCYSRQDECIFSHSRPLSISSSPLPVSLSLPLLPSLPTSLPPSLPLSLSL